MQLSVVSLADLLLLHGSLATCKARADFHPSFHELLNQFMQGCQFFSFYQLKLVDVVDEMLETRVEMRFCWEQHHMLEVGVVNVRVNPEETLEYDFDDVDEVTREGDS